MSNTPKPPASRHVVSRKRKYIYILLAAFVLMIVAARPVTQFLIWHGFAGRAGKQTLAAVDRKLKLVKIGMTREEVRTTVGDPVLVFQIDDGNKEVWTFARPYGASEYPCCVFSRKTGRVVRVIPYE